MIALNHFNQLSGEHAVAVLEPCVAVSGWAAALAAGALIYSAPPGG